MEVEVRPTPKILPAPRGTCIQCATAHGEHDPHNWWSLYYHVRFRMKWNRAASHADCVGHLPESRRRLYRQALEKQGHEWSEPAEGEPASEPYAESEG